MRVIQPSWFVETPFDGERGQEILRHLERCARTCYKSECKITSDSAPDFVRKMVRVKKHLSTIEHAGATVRFICDRGVTHEIVRHRLAAYSQESTRYCSYVQDKFGSELTYIMPVWYDDLFVQEGDRFEAIPDNECEVTCPEDSNLIMRRNSWMLVCKLAEVEYFRMIEHGAQPQEARDILPNSLKTELVMTCNMREWRHVFSMRTPANAHPQMAQIMRPLLDYFKTHLEPLFGDLDWVVTKH